MSKLCLASCFLWVLQHLESSFRNQNQTILGPDPESARDQGKTLVSSPREGLSQPAPVWESLGRWVFWKLILLTQRKKKCYIEDRMVKLGTLPAPGQASFVAVVKYYEFSECQKDILI